MITATATPAYSTADTAPDRVAGLHDFFRQLYGDDAPGHLTICSAPAGQNRGDLRTLWFEASTELHAASEAAIDLADQRRNVWFGVGLRREPKDGRGEAADVIAVPGVWSDIDIAHAVHKKECLPKSEAEALDLDSGIRLASSLIVQTGHGIQTYRKFREPWVLNSDDDRAEAQALLNRVKATMNRIAGAKNYKLDAVHDLARLLRPPFTTNWKDPSAPIPVKILSREDYLVYDPSDFDEHLDAAPAKQPPEREKKAAPAQPQKTERSKDPSFNEILDKARNAKNGDKFSRLENGSDADHGGDTSAADQAFANMLAFWFGRDYISMDAAFRQSRRMRPKWDQKHYADGTTYGTATLNKAIADCRETYEPKAKQDDALLDFPLTDAGNGERIMHRHGEALKFVARWSKPIIHIDTHWQIDETGAVDRLALETMRDLKRHGAKLAQSEDEDLHVLGIKLQRHAHVCESHKKLKDMIARAATVKGATVRPDDLDANHWLLNCRNGTLVLNDGAALKPHRKADYITKICPVDYDPSATCPTFLAFLDRVYEGKASLIDFTRRMVGYTLTGITSERAIFILYGTGANGKSTLLAIIRELMGDYATQTAADTLMAKRHEGIPNDIARLKGSRFVSATESDEGRCLAEGLVKRMTGGEDILTARFMRAEFFDFHPTFKLFLATNHKPVIKGNDPAIWDRLKLIPFNVRIPEGERDPNLLSKLKAELPGILAWAVEGCLEWQRDGLNAPAEVCEATQEYREEMDRLGDFILDSCTTNPRDKCGSTELYNCYKIWCALNGEEAMNQTRFGRQLTDKGYQTVREGNSGRKERLGIAIKETTNGSEPTSG